MEPRNEPLYEPPPPETGREIATAEGPRSLLSAIVELARDPNMDVAKLDALMQMQERMERRQAEIAFTRALAEFPTIRVKKNGRVDLGAKGSYAFARWEDIDKIIGPLLHEHGFRLTFDSQPRPGDGGGLIITGTLLHRDGHSRSASMPLPLDSGQGRNNLQANGSTLSYGKRYCAEMLLNIVREGEDNDGAGSTEPIDAESVKRLNDLIVETKSDFNGFLKFMGVKGLPEIMQKDYATAVNALLAKRARKTE